MMNSRLWRWSLVFLLLGYLWQVEAQFSWGDDLTGALPSVSARSNGRRVDTKPNVVFIMTDDQDLHLDSLHYMPHVQQLLGRQGTMYRRHYCTVAQCCPSRVSLLAGKAAQDVTPHNTNITDVGPPYGGWTRFASLGLNENWLPVWLQAANINTYYVGKLMNGHTIFNYNKPFPKGWDHSCFLLEPNTYDYTNTTFSCNNSKPMSYPGIHTIDKTTQLSLNLLDDAVKAKNPFFLTIAPVAPHVGINSTSMYEAELAKNNGNKKPHPLKLLFPIPQEKYKHAFANVTVPRTPNFNPDMPSGASWIKGLPKQNSTIVDSNDEFYRARLRVIAGVDDMVAEIVTALENYGILDSTYIIFTTDNGYHIGQHRLNPGKTCPYETDINIPFLIRGPNVPAGEISDVVTTHTDFAPTFYDIFGIPQRSDFDGSPIPLTSQSISTNSSKSEHVNVEFWGGAGTSEGIYGHIQAPNNTYKALRVYGDDYNLYYSVWCTNEYELYDLSTDPYQMHNLLATKATTYKILNGTVPAIQSRLDALLLVLKSCKGSTCVKPWLVLHPQGNVHSLKTALGKEYDVFYEKQQAKVSFSECFPGYVLQFEGPLEPLSYAGMAARAGKAADWSDFT